MILVTGSTGFVGRALCRQLAELNLPFRVLLRPSSDPSRAPGDAAGQVFADPGDVDSLAEAVRDVDTIVHCAGALVGREYDDYYRGNVLYTQNLLEALKRSGTTVQKFVLISSQAAGGPASPEGEAEVTEDDKAHPISWYGQSKFHAEEVLRAGAVPYVILRPVPVYGPGDREFLTVFKMANRGLMVTLDDGQQLVNMVYIDDLVQAILLGINSSRANRTYFVSGPGVYSQQEILNTCRRVVGREAWLVFIPAWLARVVGGVNSLVGRLFGRVPLVNRDKINEMLQRRWLCSPRRIKDELAFSAAVDLEEGFRRTLAWYREQNWL